MREGAFCEEESVPSPRGILFLADNAGADPMLPCPSSIYQTDFAADWPHEASRQDDPSPCGPGPTNWEGEHEEAVPGAFHSPLAAFTKSPAGARGTLSPLQSPSFSPPWSPNLSPQSASRGYNGSMQPLPPLTSHQDTQPLLDDVYTRRIGRSSAFLQVSRHTQGIVAGHGTQGWAQEINAGGKLWDGQAAESTRFAGIAMAATAGLPAAEVASEDPDHYDDAGYGGDADQDTEDEGVGWMQKFVPRDDLFDAPLPSRRKSRRGGVYGGMQEEDGGDDDEDGWGRIKVFQKKKRGLRSERRRVQQVREAARRGWFLSGEAPPGDEAASQPRQDGADGAPGHPALDEQEASEWVDGESLQGWGPIAPFVGVCEGDLSRAGEASRHGEPVQEFVGEVSEDVAPTCPIRVFQRGAEEAEAGDARAPLTQHLRHKLPHGPQDVAVGPDSVNQSGAGLVGGAVGGDSGGFVVGGSELVPADVRWALLPLVGSCTLRDDGAHEVGGRVQRGSEGSAARAAGEGAVVEGTRSLGVKRLKPSRAFAGVGQRQEREEPGKGGGESKMKGTGRVG